MSNVKEFRRVLDEIVERYTARMLRSVGIESRGPVLKWDVRVRASKIKQLADIAGAIELEEKGRDRFDSTCEKKCQWHVRGWGPHKKKDVFIEWYDKKRLKELCIYVFWEQGKCVYVGRTERAPKRPTDHFHEVWFRRVTRVDVYTVRKRRHLAMTECLAMHLFKPARNENKSAQQKWHSPCPVCKKEAKARSELLKLFPLRSRGKKKPKGSKQGYR